MPKSAFWSSILQVREILEEASIWQISQGNVSIWNQPWCSIWKNIHDHINLDNLPSQMPNLVSDLWDERKNWDIQKITHLFDNIAIQSIMQVQIIYGKGEDTLCWKYTSSGDCNIKSAYKKIYNDMHPVQNQANNLVKNLLKLIWKNNIIPPRVKTFGWRLLRQALPTAARINHRIKDISPNCFRCGQKEDEMHLFFHCNFSRLCWFISVFNIRVDGLSSLNSIQDIIAYLLANGANLHNLLVLLWQIWKARNEESFKTRKWEPQQVCNAAAALVKTYENIQSLEEQTHGDSQETEEISQHKRTYTSNIFAGTRCYVDASWKEGKTGIGIFIHNPENHNTIVIKATSSMSGSPLLAEMNALMLAIQICHQLQIQSPVFLSDNIMVVNAIQKEDYMTDPGHWSLRPALSRIYNILQGRNIKIQWIPREMNKMADNLAKSARELSSQSQMAFDCSNISHICHNSGCPTRRGLLLTPNEDVTIAHALCF